MVSWFTSKKTPAQSYLSTSAVPVATHRSGRTDFDSSCVRLAAIYRTDRPKNALITECKALVGWDMLSEDGRLAVQQWLCALVERAGIKTIKYPYKDAIRADFAVKAETAERLARQEALAKSVPGLQDELRDAQGTSLSWKVQHAELRTKVEALEAQHTEARGQIEQLHRDRDSLVEECSAERAHHEALQARLDNYLRMTEQLRAPSRATRVVLRQGGTAAARPLSMPPPTSAELWSIEQAVRGQDDASVS